MCVYIYIYITIYGLKDNFIYFTHISIMNMSPFAVTIEPVAIHERRYIDMGRLEARPHKRSKHMGSLQLGLVVKT